MNFGDSISELKKGNKVTGRVMPLTLESGSEKTMKEIDRRRYTKERTVAGKQEVYDSNTNQWLLMVIVLSDSSGYHSHDTSSSFSGGGGDFGGGGASSSYSDSSSSSDSGGGSSGGCD